MNLLVLAIDGRGIGHLNRALLMARSLKAVEPAAEIRFLVESPSFGLVARSGFKVLKLPDPLHDLGRFALRGQRSELEAELVSGVAEVVRPRGVLVDFLINPHLFDRLKGMRSKILVVLRRLHHVAMQQVFDDPAARWVDAWLLPHEKEDFKPDEIPSRLLPRCHFLGRLVRRLDLGQVPGIRSHYTQGGTGGKLILVSLGGGGWPEAALLSERARRAIRRLRKETPDLSAVLVHGPLFPGRLPDSEPGIHSIRFEPNLLELMAASDMVVTSAGYNSVAELLASGTPGVLIPLKNPGRDDQRLRADRACREGPVVTADLDESGIARRIRDVLGGDGPTRRPPQTGVDNHRTGKVLADLLRP